MSCCFWLSLLSGLQVCRIYPGLHTGVSLQRKWSQWLITLGILAVYHGQMCTQTRAGTLRLKGEEVRALKRLAVLDSIPVVLHEWHLLLWLLPGDGVLPGHGMSYHPALKPQRQVMSVLQHRAAKFASFRWMGMTLDCYVEKPRSMQGKKGRATLWSLLILWQAGLMASFKHIPVKSCQAKACLLYGWSNKMV